MFQRIGYSIVAMVLTLAPTLAVADGGGPPPLATFKAGQARLAWNGKPYVLRLANGTLLADYTTVLNYGMEAENPGGTPSTAGVRIQLRDVRAPGKYGNANLGLVELTLVEGIRVEDLSGKNEQQMAAMMESAMKEHRAVFDPKRSNCTAEVRRIGKTGLEGVLNCSGMGDGEGGAGPAIADLRFSAAP